MSGCGRGAAVAVLVAGTLLTVGAVSPSASSESPSPAPSPSASPSASPTTDLALPQTSSEGVVVRTYGTVQVRPYQQFDELLVTFAVHGVQRVEGGTVVYYSVGSTRSVDGRGLSELASVALGARWEGGTRLTSVRLVDRRAGQVLATVPDPNSPIGLMPDAIASETTAVPRDPDVMGVAYAVVPELAAGTYFVDVQLGFGLVVPDVPVGVGPLEPTTDTDEVIELGTGWPRVDLDTVAAVEEPESSVHPLTQVTENVDGTSVTTRQAGLVTVDVASDVLFAAGEAVVTDEGRATLTEFAAGIVTQAAPGPLSIVGHTDSTGTGAANGDLSRKRAAAVAEVLEPLALEGDLSVDADGAGEEEPVADNGTEAGRAANRRISLTFTAADG